MLSGSGAARTRWRELHVVSEGQGGENYSTMDGSL